MEELLFGLTPSEYWVYNYLQLLALRQGGTPVIIPRPGEDQKIRQIFSRKHFKRLLKSLKEKKCLTKLIIPRNKSNRIEVYLSIGASLNFGDTHVPNKKKGYTHVPKVTALRTSMSPISALGTPMSPNEPATMGICPDLPQSPSLSSSSLKILVKLKQGDLKREIKNLREEDVQKLIFMGQRESKYTPKGKKLSPRARLFALVRFIQECETIERPQAWIDTVARAAQTDMMPGRSETAPDRLATAPARHRAQGGKP